ncbi:MAG: hypothetical protein KDA86_18065 [Planctomycetaceae bacterium]|nr:hypothetical protein [Planctomycetaceae bacterium]MCA9108304.1 hypothetical protein [Planctomycetaceae bacterium]
MNISINASPDIRRVGIQEFVRERMKRTFSRFANRITRVYVTVADENGSRGGVDKLCRVTVMMPGLGQVTTSGMNENPLVASGQAADRALRMVLTRLKRRKPRRMRRRNKFLKPSETHGENTMIF